MTPGHEDETAAFTTKMIDILNKGALNLAVGIGYHSGLFEAMDTLREPATATAIAEHAGLSARYVREWLGIVGAGGIVEVSRGPGGKIRYRLPPAHGAVLTRRAGSANLGVYTQEIPILTECALAPVLDGFKTGQGVPYTRYPGFQAFMGELADAKHQRLLVDDFLPAVDGGRLLVRLHEGIGVCDLGCGQGLAAVLMARAFPQSRFIGIDISKEAISRARQTATEQGLTNVSFRVADAASPDQTSELSGRMDYVTAFDAIHDQQDPQGALAAVCRMLAEGGLFSMVDIAAHSDPIKNLDHPMAAFLYTVSLMHCMPVGLTNGGAGLGMMWGKERAEAMLRQAGFSQVDVLDIPNDSFNFHFQCRK
ncbi:MAG: methyltransferase domain-containing protein [Desulfobacterales bacterium]|nr:methyltransferase domain-containing protein [Desulfobacterales bacterium]